MFGFIGGVLLGSVATLITMCMLIAGKEEESEKGEKNERDFIQG